MSDEKRKCIVTRYSREESGTFIKYAPCQFYDESNHIYIAEQAIVELDSGKVATVDPNQITFVN